MGKKKKTLTFSQLRKANAKRNATAFDCQDWTPLEWGGAMAGECGEACNLLKKLRRDKKIDLKEIAHELADVVVYTDLLAFKLGIDLGEAVRDKFNIVSSRRKSLIRL
jgi:NTP pyrophosphatase (non-canonical NTP hydrolase)